MLLGNSKMISLRQITFPNTMRIYIALGSMLSILLRTEADDCTGLAMDAMGELRSFTRSTVSRDNIYRMVPLIDDAESVQPFCITAVKVREKLNKMKEDGCAILWIDIFLAKLNGFDYLCNEGRSDYVRHSECFHGLTEPLETDCTMTYDSLTDIHGESYHSDSSALCTAMAEYVQCSEKVVSTCVGTETEHWYRKFTEAIFSGLVARTPKLDCHFGKESSLPLWAIAVIVLVSLIVLCCIGRCLYVDGHCARCCGKRCAPRRHAGDRAHVQMEAV